MKFIKDLKDEDIYVGMIIKNSHRTGTVVCVKQEKQLSVDIRWADQSVSPSVIPLLIKNYEIVEYEYEDDDSVPDDWKPCSACYGKGTVTVRSRWQPEEESRCHRCEGYGGQCVDLDDYR